MSVPPWHGMYRSVSRPTSRQPPPPIPMSLSASKYVSDEVNRVSLWEVLPGGGMLWQAFTDTGRYLGNPSMLTLPILYLVQFEGGGGLRPVGI